MHNIAIIYLKELKDILRDKKTLILIVVLPIVVVPIIINGFVSFVVRLQLKAQTEVLSYGMLGAQEAPDLAKRFENPFAFRRVVLPSIEAFRTAIQDGRIQFGLVIRAGTATNLREGRQGEIDFYYNNASLVNTVKKRVSAEINQYNARVTLRRLGRLGVEDAAEQQALLHPFRLNEKGTADARQVLGDRFGGLLPYFFIAFCYLGIVYPAIHLGAGEKERGTLETLLLAPIPRYQIALGKFLVVFSGGITAVMLNLISLGAWLSLRGGSFSGVVGQMISAIRGFDLVLIGMMLIPIAAMFAALLLSISIYARNAGEAATYTVPVNLLIFLPVIIAVLPGVELNWRWAMVPLTNIALAIKELVKGTMDYTLLALIFGSSFLIASALLVFCTFWFRRESVLFRS